MSKIQPLYEFISHDGSFRVRQPNRSNQLYFPLVNDAGLLSAVTPELRGDIKIDQHTFLTLPVALEDLHLNRASRDCWVTVSAGRKPPVVWSVAGGSPKQRSSLGKGETVVVEGGLLYHRVERENRAVGLKAAVLNFVPPGTTAELMYVEFTNTSRRPITFTATSALPLFGRSADNLRDHRHVTSLLNRLARVPHGLELRPTMAFNERGHAVNHVGYYVLGAMDVEPPIGFFPTVESFIGAGGNMERPAAVFGNEKPASTISSAHQGKEAMGALRFRSRRLRPGESVLLTFVFGIARQPANHREIIRRYAGRTAMERALALIRRDWSERASTIDIRTGDARFNQWLRWVGVQPTLRKIYGCSFLPDFDYGRGGRGWRDLWQDCLALLLSDPAAVREDMVRNFGGVRADGTNATVIVRKQAPATESKPKWDVEFVADRNNIVRTWMDHGVWPFLTVQLYVHQTGDWSFLLEPAPYFRDGQFYRGRQTAAGSRGVSNDLKLKTRRSEVYEGSVLEHMLIELLVPFFNVGDHNVIRLEDADWNDGLDMAKERGESVAFTALYAGCLEWLAEMLEAAQRHAGWRHVPVMEELTLLLDRDGDRATDDRVSAKRARLERYFASTEQAVSGKRVSVPIATLCADLREKAASLQRRINQKEWVETKGLGWYNGYYDNLGNPVEGPRAHGAPRMTLTGQVFPLMAGLSSPDRTRKVVAAVNRWLCDRRQTGIRLNTDFGETQPHLGRAFSFVYGEKENGAVFSHMVVMYANALYRRGLIEDGYRALRSLYDLASDSGRSQIYPGLPEYFNNDRRGRYHYLTGSASWYILTVVTQAFGVRGEYGDLVLEPKLVPAQFGRDGKASVDVTFAGTRVTVNYWNTRRAGPRQAKIREVESEGRPVPLLRKSDRQAVIPRTFLEGRGAVTLDVRMGGKGE